jgi:hypothetical protein
VRSFTFTPSYNSMEWYLSIQIASPFTLSYILWSFKLFWR